MALSISDAVPNWLLSADGVVRFRDRALPGFELLLGLDGNLLVFRLSGTVSSKCESGMRVPAWPL